MKEETQSSQEESLVIDESLSKLAISIHSVDHKESSPKEPSVSEKEATTGEGVDTDTAILITDDPYAPSNLLDEAFEPLSIKDEDLLWALESLDTQPQHHDFAHYRIPHSEEQDITSFGSTSSLDEFSIDPDAIPEDFLDFAADPDIFDEPDSFDDPPLKEESERSELAAQNLVQELTHLSLSEPTVPSTTVEDESQVEDTGVTRTHPEPPPPIPWYMLCQPCSESDDDLLRRSLATMSNTTHLLDHEEEEEDYHPHEEEEEIVAQENQDEQAFMHTVSRRPRAIQYALDITTSFGAGIYQPLKENFTPKNERICLGHKETIYGVHFSDCGSYLVTASQDATVGIWKVETNSLLTTLQGHSRDYEVLRTTWAPSRWGSFLASSNDTTTTDEKSTKEISSPSLVASGGADGIVKIWSSRDASKKDSWTCVLTLDHQTFHPRREGTTNDDDKDDPPQVYALQFINHWQGLSSSSSSQDENRFFLTSSQDYVHLWELKRTNATSDELEYSEVMSIRFKSSTDFNAGVSVVRVTLSGLHVTTTGESDKASTTLPQEEGIRFGGDRNPDNLVFVFDASYCQANGLLGAALSDGTLRLVNGRGVCVALLALPGCRSHLTSFTWDSQGTRLASCVATGHTILWNLDHGQGHTTASCVAVLEGGHSPGRPLFGAKYCGGDKEELLVTWGSDGRLCLWDSYSQGQINAPISTLVSRSDYPIYSVDVVAKTTTTTTASETPHVSSSSTGVWAVAGGREGGFLGLPLYLYDIHSV